MYYSHFIYRCAKIKKNNSGAKRLKKGYSGWSVNLPTHFNNLLVILNFHVFKLFFLLVYT